MKYNTLIIGFGLFVSTGSLLAQITNTSDCKSMDGFLEKMKVHEPMKYQKFIKEQKNLNIQRNKDMTDADYIIPVAFYIFETSGTWGGGNYDFSDITDAVVYDALAHLNKLFREHKTGGNFDQLIQFCLVTEVNGEPITCELAAAEIETPVYYNNGDNHIEYDYITQAPANSYYGYDSPGIFRISELLFTPNGPPSNYSASNIWNGMTEAMLLPEDEVLRIAIGRSVSGNATMPFSTNGYYGTGHMGVYVGAEVFGSPNNCAHCLSGAQTGWILAHEVAHYFGVFHTYESGCAGYSTLNCADQGDFVCDTEPRPSTAPSPTTGCSYPTDCSSASNPITYDNIMEFTNDICVRTFTQGQIDRVEIILQSHFAKCTTDCNLYSYGLQCYEPLVLGPYCSNEDIQLESIKGSGSFNQISGSGEISSSGFISSSEAISDSYQVEITECGYTREFDFEIMDCPAYAEFSFKSMDCEMCFWDQTPIPDGATSVTYTWSFPDYSGVSKPNSNYICHTREDYFPATHLSCYDICLEVSYSHSGVSFYDMICKQICPNCNPSGSKLKPSNLEESEQNFDKINVVPNPTSGVFQIRGINSLIPATISISDVSGRIVLNEQRFFSSSTELDLNNQPSGLYILNIRQAEFSKNFKIIMK